MSFKVNDLVISVVEAQAKPDVKLCLRYCTWLQPRTPCFGCSIVFSPCAMKCSFMPTHFQECPPMSIDCGLTRDPTIVYTPRTPEIITEQVVTITDPGEFVELKAGLRKALEMVEMQERAVEQQMAPKTLEEAKMLQDKLEGALKSAQAMVREMSKNK